MARGYSVIALDNPKDNHNVGSVLRAAKCYGAAMVVTSGKRYHPASTDTTQTVRHKPLLCVDDVFAALPYDCVPVAVDLIPGAISLNEYKHPVRAFYIFGAEDATLGERILSRCRDVVYIPTDGCMNLAACVNVVMYDRQTKEQRPKGSE